MVNLIKSFLPKGCCTIIHSRLLDVAEEVEINPDANLQLSHYLSMQTRGMSDATELLLPEFLNSGLAEQPTEHHSGFDLGDYIEHIVESHMEADVEHLDLAMTD